MGLIVNTNLAALNAQRHLSANTRSVQVSMERLATGYRINHAGDDIAGLSLSNILETQVRGSKMALRNAQDGASLLQVAEGALITVTDNIQRIRELSVQAANGTYGSTERTAIAQEIRARIDDIQRIAISTKFNSTSLLVGNQSINLQVGPNTAANVDYFGISAALTCATAGLNGIDISYATLTADFAASAANVRTYINQVDSALRTLFTRRSTIGAYQARLDSVINNLEISIENLSASNSRIKDVDIAQETANLTRNQVLQQSAISILAQANQMPALALNLIGR